MTTCSAVCIQAHVSSPSQNSKESLTTWSQLFLFIFRRFLCLFLSLLPEVSETLLSTTAPVSASTDCEEGVLYPAAISLEASTSLLGMACRVSPAHQERRFQTECFPATRLRHHHAVRGRCLTLALSEIDARSTADILGAVNFPSRTRCCGWPFTPPHQTCAAWAASTHDPCIHHDWTLQRYHGDCTRHILAAVLSAQARASPHVPQFCGRSLPGRPAANCDALRRLRGHSKCCRRRCRNAAACHHGVGPTAPHTSHCRDIRCEMCDFPQRHQKLSLLDAECRAPNGGHVKTP